MPQVAGAAALPEKESRKGSRWLPVGTRSLLYGVHAFWLHPIFVWRAWWRLYGFPWDPRLYLAFLIHDIGYVGCRSMDGWEGKLHPQLGGEIMRRLFGGAWGDLVSLHSRHYAKLMGREPSRLCGPDKLASALYPMALYLLLANLSGEIHEYTRRENCVVLEQKTGIQIVNQVSWFRALQSYMLQEARRTA
jgi:hypothetical protein